MGRGGSSCPIPPSVQVPQFTWTYAHLVYIAIVSVSSHAHINSYLEYTFSLMSFILSGSYNLSATSFPSQSPEERGLMKTSHFLYVFQSLLLFIHCSDEGLCISYYCTASLMMTEPDTASWVYLNIIRSLLLLCTCSRTMVFDFLKSPRPIHFQVMANW